MKRVHISALAKVAWVLALSAIPVAVPAASHIIAWGENSSGETNVAPDLTNVIAIAVLRYGNLALKAEGTLAAWPQTDTPIGLSNVVAIACGEAHSLALRADETVAVWGRYVVAGGAGDSSAPVDPWVPEDLTNVIAIAGASSHSLALKTDGSVIAWGLNAFGQLDLPPCLTNVVAIAAGGFKSAALKADGTLVIWPIYDEQSGRYTFFSPSTRFTNVTALAVGSEWTSATVVLLQADGTATALEEAESFSISDVIPDVVAIATDHWHHGGEAVYLKADGTIRSTSSVLGQMPAGLTNGLGIAVISSHYSHGLALIGDGSPLAMKPMDRTVAQGGTIVLQSTAVVGAPPLAYQWTFNGARIAGATNPTLRLVNAQLDQTGAYSVVVSNAFGEVTSAAALVSVVPLLIISQPKSQSTFRGATVVFEAAAAGQGPFNYQWQFNGKDLDQATNSTLVLVNVQADETGDYSLTVRNASATVRSGEARLEVGRVATWGSNSSGLPRPFGLTNILAIAAGGGDFSVVLKSDGTILTWGLWFGLDSFLDLSNVVAIAASGLPGLPLALRADGTVSQWTSSGTLAVPDLTNAVAIAGGGAFNLALRANGTVLAWSIGWDGHADAILPATGPSAPPTGLSNVVAIAAGPSHGLALRRNGTVVAWGNNQSGQTSVPPTLTNVVAITAGWNSSLALRSDGTIVAWGTQTNVPPGLTNVIGVAAGPSHTLALKADGTVVAWGSNGFGETNVPPNLRNVMAIAANWDQSMALIGDGPPVQHASIINPRSEGGRFGCTIPTENGRVYQLEFKDTFSDPDWKALPLVAGNGNFRTLTDTTAVGSQRFYRVQRW